VIVPAHDEEEGIVRTIEAIQPQLNPGDRLIVVADNCTDRTIEVASAAGAETIERTNSTLRGKGFALHEGVKYLGTGTSPQVVVIVDADCIVAPGCISCLVNSVERTGRPVQGTYLMRALIPSSATRIAEFAFKIKNYVRPAGGAQFGLPCLLYGTGMAFPWNLVQGSILANGHLAEDLKLAIELSLLGFPPVFSRDAVCYSAFPLTDTALLGQRRRWEHGYFSSVVEYLPKLLLDAFARRDWKLFAVALELSIPPLALMMVITALISLLGVFAMFAGSTISIAPILAMYFPIFATLLTLAWYFHGRDLISAGDVLELGKHTIRRLCMVGSFLIKPQREWVRTERKKRD
jgi:cellulose synthase/poly-beta-1,6-N-acetylglucosamine synthase-like glycosyltransferase